MADQKISDMTDGTPALVTDEVPAIRSGANIRLPLSSVAALGGGTPGATGPAGATGPSGATGPTGPSGVTTEAMSLAISDETSDLTVGTAKLTFRMPYGFTLTGVRASVNTAPVGSTIVVDINEAGVSILSTKLSIDASEKTSASAATPAVISDPALADDAEITVDIDQVGSSTPGKGLKVVLIGHQ